VTGPQLQNAFNASVELEKKGVSCDLIYLSTIKPLSENAKHIVQESMRKTGKAVSVEEHTVIGGIADEVALQCASVPFVHRRMGIQDKFLTNYGTYQEHCVANGLTREGIIREVELLYHV
jgi:transketolase